MTQSRRAFLAQGCAGAALVLAGCTGGDATEATLSVESQSGDGETLTIDEVSAEEEYYVALRYDDAEATTEPFEAGSTQESLAVDLEPTLQEGTTVEVAVLSAESDSELASTEVDYQIAPEGSLTVEDQQGGGQRLTIAEASANVEYYLRVFYAGEQFTTEPLPAGSSRTDLLLDFEPPLAQSAAVDVELLSASTDEVLAASSLQYEVVADLALQWGSGDGTSMTIDRVGASEDYYVTLSYDGETLSTETFGGGTTQNDLTVDLVPAIDHTKNVDVAVHSASTDEILVQRTVQYKYYGAVLDVQDQSGDGGSLDVARAEGAVRFYVEARYDGEVSTSRRFSAGSVVDDVTISLTPPIQETTTVQVAVRNDANDEVLYSKQIEYSVS